MWAARLYRLRDFGQSGWNAADSFLVRALHKGSSSQLIPVRPNLWPYRHPPNSEERDMAMDEIDQGGSPFNQSPRTAAASSTLNHHGQAFTTDQKEYLDGFLRA